MSGFPEVASVTFEDGFMVASFLVVVGVDWRIYIYCLSFTVFLLYFSYLCLGRLNDY